MGRIVPRHIDLEHKIEIVHDYYSSTTLVRLDSSTTLYTIISTVSDNGDNCIEFTRCECSSIRTRLIMEYFRNGTNYTDGCRHTLLSIPFLVRREVKDPSENNKFPSYRNIRVY